MKLSSEICAYVRDDGNSWITLQAEEPDYGFYLTVEVTDEDGEREGRTITVEDEALIELREAIDQMLQSAQRMRAREEEKEM